MIKKILGRILVVAIITVLYFGPWHEVRYYFAKEWFMPKIANINTYHSAEFDVGGYGSGVGFEVISKWSNPATSYHYKASGGWFLLLPLVTIVLAGIKSGYGFKLFLFHVAAILVNAMFFFLGVAYSTLLLAIADLSCYYLVPGISLAMIPFLIIQKNTQVVMII